MYGYFRKVAGSSPDRVIPKTLKMVPAASSSGVQCMGMEWESYARGATSGPAPRCSFHCIHRRVVETVIDATRCTIGAGRTLTLMSLCSYFCFYPCVCMSVCLRVCAFCTKFLEPTGLPWNAQLSLLRLSLLFLNYVDIQIPLN